MEQAFVTLVVAFFLGALAHKLLSERRTSPPIRPSGDDCEVLLSFADAQKSFADLLYDRLVGVGIRVFRDHDEVRAGEELGPEVLKAINNGEILIPIISENYASSKSCLDQLVRMMERQKHSGRRLVFPIFYKVKAADVPEQRGSFGEAFGCYRRSFDGTLVAEWKKALKEVSELTTPWESESFTDGREEELVKLVAEQVSQELKRRYLVDTDYLVGIDSHVDKVMQLIDERSSAVVIVGIYGRVGIGKTTLVKAIDKKLSSPSYWHSFIEDIRKSCNRNSIVNLQNQLITDMLERNDFQASDVPHGISILTSVFKDKKALIILDDVDNTEQLDDLVGMSHSLAPGSRIFFTTRNESVLGWAKVDRKYGVYRKYALEELNEEQRLILFSRHAFRRDSPPNEEFSALARPVVSMTGGLPLALEIVGSFLCGKPAEVWRETIKKMENMPHMVVQEKLMIGYYLLEEKQKQMFLDIACFLIGSDARLASYMWDACGFFATEGIEVLRSLSFIKIGDNHELRMQNQMRDLGRKIVRIENPREPHHRSRLWDYEEALGVLERKEKVMTIDSEQNVEI
ncbi:disease resistance protein L6-like [Rhodamnia argentea]|uniref:Disease resistance protein L6-like n=1 Tax=Rhodamnia argentea TaxID=178133 RepID=A0ABM3HAV9_9MYRT|nr:disease resistance protein L6-like [Rhodamnia argentea]